MSQSPPTKVVHCCRSPVGGLFRHVRDLICGQAEIGMQVGLICDQSTGGSHADEALKDLAPYCDLGICRLSMNRSLHLSDMVIVRTAARNFRKSQPDIIHGHGAKGGAYGRLLSKRLGSRAIYTPHGGALHYPTASTAGLVYSGLERVLQRYTHGLIFESEYSADVYARKIGMPACRQKVIHNGLNDDEFDVIAPGPRAENFVFIGELRKIKGLDVLLQATDILRQQRQISVLIAGDGPDVAYLKSRIQQLGLTSVVKMSPPIYPARRAFLQADCLVVPSLAESFPYIVLEAAGARFPMLASHVGGIPEIFGPYADKLVPAHDPTALAQAMSSTMNDPDQALRLADQLHSRVASTFRKDNMVSAITEFYDEVACCD